MGSSIFISVNMKHLERELNKKNWDVSWKK